jgi:dipeptidase E
MKNIIIASTSTLHGGEYLDYLLPELQKFFSNVNEILFIPYARPSGISYDDYTKKVSKAFAKINIAVKGIHEFENPSKLLKKLKEFLLAEEIPFY